MYGDDDVLRRRVDQLREQAVDVRSLADRLVDQTEALGWRGRAAEAMRERVTERAAHLRDAAARHDTAADSLDRHVQERGTVVDAIADAERKATTAIADAKTRVARARQSSLDPGLEAGPQVAPDPDDVALASVVVPPPGHRDWLTFETPAASA